MDYEFSGLQGASGTAAVRRRLGNAGYRIAAEMIAVLGVCVGTMVDATMIGETGSRAVWEGHFSPTR